MKLINLFKKIWPRPELVLPKEPWQKKATNYYRLLRNDRVFDLYVTGKRFWVLHEQRSRLCKTGIVHLVTDSTTLTEKDLEKITWKIERLTNEEK